MTPNSELIARGGGETNLNVLYKAYIALWNCCKYGTWSRQEVKYFNELKEKYPGLYDLVSDKQNGVHRIGNSV